MSTRPRRRPWFRAWHLVASERPTLRELLARHVWSVTGRWLVAALLLLTAVPARADCRCTVDASPCPTEVVCDATTFTATVDALLQAEHDRDVARAANVRLAEELRVRITPPESSVWPWAAGSLVVGIVLGVVLAR